MLVNEYFYFFLKSSRFILHHLPSVNIEEDDLLLSRTTSSNEHDAYFLNYKGKPCTFSIVSNNTRPARYLQPAGEVRVEGEGGAVEEASQVRVEELRAALAAKKLNFKKKIV